jgi:hypothetical protein
MAHARGRRWMSRLFQSLIVVGFVLFWAILADYEFRVAPAIDKAIYDFEVTSEPDSAVPVIIELVPLVIWCGGATATAWLLAIFTLLTWRCHGRKIKIIGFSPLMLMFIGGFIRRLF